MAAQLVIKLTVLAVLATTVASIGMNRWYAYFSRCEETPPRHLFVSELHYRSNKFRYMCHNLEHQAAAVAALAVAADRVAAVAAAAEVVEMMSKWRSRAQLG